MELIRKNDALHAVLHNTGDAAVAAVQGIKAVDAVPVVHGEWYRPKEWSTKTYRRLCTNCHDVAYFCGSGNYRYCPNCGAKMKGANDEADSDVQR